MKILIVEDQFIEAYDLKLILEKAGYEVTGIAHSVTQAKEMLATVKPDIVCLDIFLDGNETGIDLAKKLKEQHIAFIYISANSDKSILDEVKITEPYGFIIKPFRDQDVLTTLEIAGYRHRHNAESLLHGITTLQQDIDSISRSEITWPQAMLELGRNIQSHIPFDYLEASHTKPLHRKYDGFGLFRRNFDDYTAIDAQKFSEITIFSIEELARIKSDSPQYTEAAFYDTASFKELCEKSAIKKLVAQSFGIRSFITLPVLLPNGHMFAFEFYSKQPDCYSPAQLTLLANLEKTLANFAASRQLSPSQEIQASHKTATAIADVPNTLFEGIIGNSKKMLTVFDYIKKVAPSDTSVLILGESGTGKEKVAYCIHKLSKRKDRPYIVVNCGAIPDNLSESMLFGHEKGAFTGAIERKIGKFELADNGTIFLDEIGEMPISLQVKLLRVLQENEIERVGGRSPIKINARIIAATNKNLEEEVAAGRFRMDLYYRLHVFPITVPALRERRDDLPALAEFFTGLYSKKIGRKNLLLSESVMGQVMAYDWPGNIRQLEHLIQRSILLTEGNTIRELNIPRLPHKHENTDASLFENGSVKTIYENERDYICYILKKCNGKVYGSGGAAELLNIPPSTLNSKIKKLGIKLKAF